MLCPSVFILPPISHHHASRINHIVLLSCDLDPTSTNQIYLRPQVRSNRRLPHLITAPLPATSHLFCLVLFCTLWNCSAKSDGHTYSQPASQSASGQPSSSVQSSFCSGCPCASSACLCLFLCLFTVPYISLSIPRLGLVACFLSLGSPTAAASLVSSPSRSCPLASGHLDPIRRP